jgi:hypothetical protein
MSQLRNLLNDLVEKRLWPVALALVAALVAVPLVLAKSAPSGGGGASAPLASDSVPAGTPVAGEPAVSVAQGSEPAAPLRGHAVDPFHQTAPAATTPAAGPPATSGAPVGSPGAGGGTGASPGGGTRTPPGGGGGKPVLVKRRIWYVGHIDVRFGKPTGTLRTYVDLPRLSALPSATDPVAIFLGFRLSKGTKLDLKTAVFMLSSDVHAQGDGRCVPSPKDCEGIELQEGETELLDVAANDGKVTQYELDYVRNRITQTFNKPAAAAAYARSSRAGQRLMRSRALTSPLATGLRYSPAQGALVAPSGSFLSAAAIAPAGTPAAGVEGAPPASAQALAEARFAGALVPAP